MFTCLFGMSRINNNVIGCFFTILFQVWSKTTSDIGDSLSGDIPTFSLSPQGYITEVLKHI